jgi:hypothetical protein
VSVRRDGMSLVEGIGRRGGRGAGGNDPCWDHLERISRVRSRTFEVALDQGFVIGKDESADSDLPVEVRAHFSFHLIEHSLGADEPEFVAVCVVADDLGGDDEG